VLAEHASRYDAFPLTIEIAVLEDYARATF
jgi:hypothetical protein